VTLLLNEIFVPVAWREGQSL